MSTTLEVITGQHLISKPLHKTPQEYEAFRKSWRKQITPGLMEDTEKRAGSEDYAKHHMVD